MGSTNQSEKYLRASRGAGIFSQETDMVLTMQSYLFHLAARLFPSNKATKVNVVLVLSHPKINHGGKIKTSQPSWLFLSPWPFFEQSWWRSTW